MNELAERRKSKRDALLDLLSDGQWHTHQECMAKGGSRFGGRLFELRKRGLVVETKQRSVDEFEYRLIPHGQQRMI